jgi:hypothetical protein
MKSNLPQVWPPSTVAALHEPFSIAGVARLSAVNIIGKRPGERMNLQVICLNMIVKNESAVIRRCLDFVRPLTGYG